MGVPLLTLDEVLAAIDAVTARRRRRRSRGALRPGRRCRPPAWAATRSPSGPALDAVTPPSPPDAAHDPAYAVSGAAGAWARPSAGPSRAPRTSSSSGAPTRRSTSPSQDVLGDADVVVDFSRPDTALDNARLCLEAGVHCVMGTTGADFHELAGVGSANLFVAPELRHRRGADDGGGQAGAPGTCPSARSSSCTTTPKLDAPSGTAARTAELIARGRRQRPRADPLRAPARPRGPPGGHLRRRSARR